jgi:hypothetical protein
MTSPAAFAFGQFKPHHGREWNGKIVNLTKHGGEKTGDDPAEYRGLTFVYASDRHHVLLAQPGTEDPVAVVFLEDIATIEQVAP